MMSVKTNFFLERLRNDPVYRAALAAAPPEDRKKIIAITEDYVSTIATALADVTKPGTNEPREDVKRAVAEELGLVSDKAPAQDG